MDKLDGRIDNEFFDRKAADFRAEQCRLMRDIDAHQVANKSYIEEGIKLLELAHQAHRLFESQPPSEKRKLLDFVLSNCRWKDGQLEADYRQPFDLIAAAAQATLQVNSGGNAGNGKFDNWRRGGDSSLPSVFSQDNLLIRRFAWGAKTVPSGQVKHATHT
jgi:hypothetical protein